MVDQTSPLVRLDPCVPGIALARIVEVGTANIVAFCFSDEEAALIVAAVNTHATLREENAAARSYLSNLFTTVAPQCRPSDSLLTLCTQIDNYIAWRLQELSTLTTQLAEWSRQREAAVKALHAVAAEIRAEECGQIFPSNCMINIDELVGKALASVEGAVTP